MFRSGEIMRSVFSNRGAVNGLLHRREIPVKCCVSNDHSGNAGALQRERIQTDGVTSIRWSSPLSQLAQQPAGPVVGQQAVGVPSLVPDAPPISDKELESLLDFFVSNKRIAVVTGAGISTESDIPDYRGPNGAYTTGYKPMSHQQFMAKVSNRSRYWARNYAGWEEFYSRKPNLGHESLARLERLGWIEGVITQNVDRLHQRAGGKNILELHGTTHKVVCTQCGVLQNREDFQSILSEMNPDIHKIVYNGIAQEKREFRKALREPLSEDDHRMVRPDGDVEIIGGGMGFKVPNCSECGGVLKPHVVFFGDSVPRKRSVMALKFAESVDGLLVVGSSVMVYSAFKLVKSAHDKHAKIAILNVGPTRADSITDVKVEAIASEVLTRLATHPTLLMPRT